MRDLSQALEETLTLMDELLSHIHAFDQRRLAFAPPVLDESTGTTWRSEDTQGLRKFVDTIENNAESFRALAASGVPPREDPYPIAAGLVTAWKQLVIARTPVPAVRMSVSPAGTSGSWDPVTGKAVGKKKGKGKGGEVFVDVVARGGAEWIRIYSKKPNQLLAEFREQDSYLASDDEWSDAEDAPTAGLQNSLLKLVDDLLALADTAERIPGAEAPKLTLRLSRIEEFPEGGHADPRIPATFAAVRARGVNLVFGDLSEYPLATLPTVLEPPPILLPSRRLNLDPTALMGLCSDLLHHPLPADAAGARERYYRPPGLVGGKDDEDDAAQSQNSRELVRALLEEMDRPLVEVIRDALESSPGSGPVEFWATRQSVNYLQETICSESTIGEGGEQRRMRRLTGLEEGDFWEGSRYAGREGCMKGLRIKVFDEDANGIDGVTNGIAALSTENPGSTEPLERRGMTSFHNSLAAVSSTFVREYTSSVYDGASTPTLPAFLQPRRLPAPRVARISVPFTVVALDALARGAREGMTTLSMGHVVFRELFTQPRWRVKGWAQGNYELEASDAVHAGASNGHATEELVQHAAVWLLPYRSLGEGKRVKFAAGDYSFPAFVQRVMRGERKEVGAWVEDSPQRSGAASPGQAEAAVEE